ncbi:hypothetical protein AAMO2058_000644700 [Amorphochlora amoebiformis]|eukprot:1395522-Amorphochlora_amoeboformis.AAC.2
MDDNNWITKCPCGQNQDADGLMIQCDRCLVWQHGDCVGLFTEASVPDQYFCEQCKPQHKIHQEARRRRAEVTQARQIRIARARGRLRVERQEKDRVGRKPNKKKSVTKRPKPQRAKATPEPTDSSSSRPSREQRKIERILESFRKLDEKSKKKTSGNDKRTDKRTDRRENGHSDKKKRGRPRRNKRKAETRAPPGEVEGVIPVARLIAISPMYLGRKAWLMRSYRKDQLLKRFNGFEQMVEKQSLPLNKRMLLNFNAHQGDSKAPQQLDDSSSKVNGHETSKANGHENTIIDTITKDGVNVKAGPVHANGLNGKLKAMHVTAS